MFINWQILWVSLIYYHQNLFELEIFVHAGQESLIAWVEGANEAFSQQNLNDSLAPVAFSVSTETPKAALRPFLELGLWGCVFPALPRLRGTSCASTELRTAGGVQGWICTCVSKMLMLQLSTRSLFLNTVVNIDSSQVSLSKFPSLGSQLLKSSCSPKKANCCIHIWHWLESISISLDMHPAYICSLPWTLVSLEKKSVHTRGRKR